MINGTVYVSVSHDNYRPDLLIYWPNVPQIDDFQLSIVADYSTVAELKKNGFSNLFNSTPKFSIAEPQEITNQFSDKLQSFWNGQSAAAIAFEGDPASITSTGIRWGTETTGVKFDVKLNSVSNINDLIDQIETGLETGAMTSAAIYDDGDEIFKIEFSNSNWSITSDDLIINLEGQLPISLSAAFELGQTLTQDIPWVETLTNEEFNDLKEILRGYEFHKIQIQELNNFNAELRLEEGEISVALNELSLSILGDFPSNLEEIFEASEFFQYSAFNPNYWGDIQISEYIKIENVKLEHANNELLFDLASNIFEAYPRLDENILQSVEFNLGFALYSNFWDEPFQKDIQLHLTPSDEVIDFVDISNNFRSSSWGKTLIFDLILLNDGDDSFILSEDFSPAFNKYNFPKNVNGGSGFDTLELSDYQGGKYIYDWNSGYFITNDWLQSESGGDSYQSWINYLNGTSGTIPTSKPFIPKFENFEKLKITGNGQNNVHIEGNFQDNVVELSPEILVHPELPEDPNASRYLIYNGGSGTDTLLISDLLSSLQSVNDIQNDWFLRDHFGKSLELQISGYSDTIIRLTGVEQFGFYDDNLNFQTIKLNEIPGAINLKGSSSDESLIGTDESDELMGLSGDDDLYGFDGDDFLIGGIGKDNLDGGAGADWINGGGGAYNDVLTGGSGADTFVFNRGFGDDIITDYQDNFDKINFIGYTEVELQSVTRTISSDGYKVLNLPDKSTLTLMGPSSEDVHLAVIFDKTGPIKDLTADMYAAAHLAADEINLSSNFLSGLSVILHDVDSTAINADAAIANLTAVMDEYQIDGLIGADTSGVSASVLSGIADQNNLVMMSPSATSPYINDADLNDLFFRTTPNDNAQAVKSAEYLWGQGITTVTILREDSLYGQSFSEAFSGYFTSLGGTINFTEVADESFDISQSDLDNLYSTLLAIGYWDNSALKSALSNALSSNNFDHVHLSDGLLTDNQILMDTNGLLEGATGFKIKPPLSEFTDLVALDGSKFNSVSPFSGEAYDAVAIMALAMHSAKSTDPLIYKDHIDIVTNAGGTEIHAGELALAFEILSNGGAINYVGATDVEFDALGDDYGPYDLMSAKDGQFIIAVPATLQLDDANSSPDVISEGSAAGSLVGITADAGDGYTYALKEDANGRFAIDATSGVVTVANALGLDYEFAQSHEIIVEATASDGVTKVEKSFSVNVSDNPDEPVILYEISNNGSELVLGVRVDPSYDLVNPEFVDYMTTLDKQPYPGLEDFTFFIDYDATALSVKKNMFGNVVKDQMDLTSFELVEQQGSDNTLRASGYTSISSEDLPIDLASGQTVFSVTFDILDSDAPLGFRTYNHSLDGTSSSDSVYSEVSSITFEKTSALVDGTITSLQGHDVLGDAKMYLADITAPEGIYIRATSMGETSSFEIVMDHTAAVDTVSFDLGTTASITNFSSAISNLTPTVDTSVSNTATFSLDNASSVLSANSEHVLATFEASGMGEFTLSSVSMMESGDTSATSLQDVSLLLSSSDLATGGVFNVEVSGTDAQLTLGNLDYDTAMEASLSYPLTAADALDALKMSVGLSPSAASGRDITVAEYIAADVNADGSVFASDALNILKASVGLGLGTSNGPSFAIIDDSADYTGLDELNVDYSSIITLNDIQDDQTLDLSLILLGDVNGFA